MIATVENKIRSCSFSYIMTIASIDQVDKLLGVLTSTSESIISSIEKPFSKDRIFIGDVENLGETLLKAMRDDWLDFLLVIGNTHSFMLIVKFSTKFSFSFLPLITGMGNNFLIHSGV